MIFTTNTSTFLSASLSLGQTLTIQFKAASLGTPTAFIFLGSWHGKDFTLYFDAAVFEQEVEEIEFGVRSDEGFFEFLFSFKRAKRAVLFCLDDGAHYNYTILTSRPFLKGGSSYPFLVGKKGKSASDYV